MIEDQTIITNSITPKWKNTKIGYWINNGDNEESNLISSSNGYHIRSILWFHQSGKDTFEGEV